MANRWGSNGNGGSLYFLGLLTLCSWVPCLLHMAGTLMTPAQSAAAVSTPHPSSLQNLLLGLCFSQASSSSVYSRHLFLVCSASARSIPFLSFIVAIFAWGVQNKQTKTKRTNHSPVQGHGGYITHNRHLQCSRKV